MTNETYQQLDALVIGAGFSGLQMLYALREKGYSVKGIEAADEVGGVWNTNRYPGARSDTPGVYYSYFFDKEIYNKWKWDDNTTYPSQEEILEYHKYTADAADLRKDFVFNTKVTKAEYDVNENLWKIETSTGQKFAAKYFIPCIGCLTVSHSPTLPEQENFKGKIYHTSEWPTTPVDFTGKRVAVFGTGSSGVQAIPEIAKTAKSLTVFQRTPQYVSPGRQELMGPDLQQKIRDNFDTIRQDMRTTSVGVPGFFESEISALSVSDEEREKIYEQCWETVGGATLYAFSDVRTDDAANQTIQDFYRKKIRSIVKDPVVAEKLCPDYLFGAKRPVIGFNYYETFNEEHVKLVSLKEEPIVRFTETGIETAQGLHELDVVVFATGFDALTGPLMKFNMIGKEGRTLKEKWEDGHNLKSYLGLLYNEFPNMFSISGPHWAYNVQAAANIDYVVEFIMNTLEKMEKSGADYIEPSKEVEEDWTAYVNKLAEGTIYTRVESWYNGANIEGKARGVLGFTAGFLDYIKYFENVKKSNYEGVQISSTQNV